LNGTPGTPLCIRLSPHSARMVNAGFRKPRRYGFEIVDACMAHLKSRTLHQSKIYAKSSRHDLSRIFSDLRRSEILAIYRGLLRRIDCQLQAQRDKTGIGEMFFLLRMAFWLGLVLVLMPREKTPESGKLPQIGASEAVSAATAAVSDMGQFCKRQPAACEVGGQAATVLGQRAQDGAKKLYQIITDKKSPDHTGSIGGIDDAGMAAVAAPRDTLTPDDLQVEWRPPAGDSTTSN
jgi:Family of unknown function (DUF5330)